MFGPKFRQIEKLRHYQNKIKAIEEGAFVHLPNLVEIVLNGNQIESLSAKVFEKNRELKLVDLEGNKIKMIAPETFRNLNQLKFVHLGKNECVGKEYGCWRCYNTKIDHTELNSDLHVCYENHRKSLDLLNERENKFFHENTQARKIHYHSSYSKSSIRSKLMMGPLPFHSNVILTTVNKNESIN
jgi:Leucine-rich repeat (LRR) protein